MTKCLPQNLSVEGAKNLYGNDNFAMCCAYGMPKGEEYFFFDKAYVVKDIEDIKLHEFVKDKLSGVAGKILKRYTSGGDIMLKDDVYFYGCYVNNEGRRAA